MRGGRQQDSAEKYGVGLEPLFQDCPKAEDTYCNTLSRPAMWLSSVGLMGPLIAIEVVSGISGNIVRSRCVPKLPARFQQAYLFSMIFSVITSSLPRQELFDLCQQNVGFHGFLQKSIHRAPGRIACRRFEIYAGLVFDPR